MKKDADRDRFAANLELAMQRLNLSKVELAHRMGVDKSVVRRWALGGARPSEANISALTDLVSQEVRGFNRASWQEDPERVAVLLELAPPQPQPVRSQGIADLLPHFSARAAAAAAWGMECFSGLWVQFYAPLAAAPLLPLFCGAVRIHSHTDRLWYHVSDGRRGVWTGGGPAFTVDGKLWVLLEEYRGRSDLCTVVYQGTSGHRAMILDGLAMARAANAGGVPVVGRFTLVRLADDPADEMAADALFHRLSERAGELSLGNLPAALPDWLVHLLRGDDSGWQNRHQAFVMALSDADNLTTDELDLDLHPVRGRSRREIVEASRALFASALADGEG